MQSHETSHSSKSSENSASVPVLNLFPARQFGVPTQTESIAENTGLDEANGYCSHSSLNLGHIAVSAPGAPPLEPPPQPSPLILQRRLNIGRSGDKYEVEADKGASQVVNLINSPLFRNIQSQKISSPRELEPESQTSIQRQSTGLNPFNISVYEPGTTPPPPIQTVRAKGDNIKAASGNIEDTIKSKKGSGEELADNVREPMETAFDANFSRVKVHTDGESDQLNKSLNSRAFATGQDIFFSQGAYNPGSRDGQELLAHELTHIVQQNRGIQRKIVQHQTTEQKIVQMMPKVKSGNLSVKDAQIALAKANKELAFELAQTAADIAGIVDPTPISDGISAAMSLAKGDYFGAGLSIVSMIPYLGDTIGKPIKAARNGKKILKLRKEIAELIQIIEKFSPAGRKASAKTKDAVAQEIKQVLKLKKSPQYDQRIRKRAVADTKGYETTYGKNAQTKFRKHNTETFKGTLRGEKIELRGVSSQPVSYTKRSRNEYKQLRSQFDTSERKNFVQNISSDPDKVKKLKEAGLTDIRSVEC